jgi:hypothetical protein
MEEHGGCSASELANGVCVWHLARGIAIFVRRGPQTHDSDPAYKRGRGGFIQGG